MMMAKTLMSVQIGVPEDCMRLRTKIMRNLAVAQFRLHDCAAALRSFELIMDAEPNARDGFSIILCHCRLAHEPQQLKDAFSDLVNVQLKVRLLLG